MTTFENMTDIEKVTCNALANCAAEATRAKACEVETTVERGENGNFVAVLTFSGLSHDAQLRNMQTSNAKDMIKRTRSVVGFPRIFSAKVTEKSFRDDVKAPVLTYSIEVQ